MRFAPFLNISPRFVKPKFTLWHYLSRKYDARFVPAHEQFSEDSLQLLQDFIDRSEHLVAITGAGISTESGIPDYRSEGVGLYATSNHKPTQYMEFLRSAKLRKRYWIRNYAGWPRFASLQPSIAHESLSEWERHGKLRSIITQNIDRLHQKAGSSNVIELHGSAFEVECINCSFSRPRADFQEILSQMNQGIKIESSRIRPDSDVDVINNIEDFNIPDCPSCGGLLKPRIVFFGDSVPKSRNNLIRNEIRQSDAVLVIGTTLTVYSAYRFILLAAELKIPIGIINIGETRGDKFSLFRVPARCGEILPLIKT